MMSPQGTMSTSEEDKELVAPSPILSCQCLSCPVLSHVSCIVLNRFVLIRPLPFCAVLLSVALLRADFSQEAAGLCIGTEGNMCKRKQ